MITAIHFRALCGSCGEETTVTIHYPLRGEWNYYDNFCRNDRFACDICERTYPSLSDEDRARGRVMEFRYDSDGYVYSPPFYDPDRHAHLPRSVTIDRSGEVWGTSKEEVPCDCGAPEGHVPGGIHCRR